jgi:phosphoribosylamine--glycine ligase
MAVSRGYPTSYEKGFPISGLDGKYGKQSLIFQAGTTQQNDEVVTNGGRVLCVTSLGESIQEAVDISLDVLEYIRFEGIYYRQDIGYEFISREA